MDDAVSGHMVAEAMLTAHFIAAALKAGMSQAEINAILAEVADRSARARRQALQIRGRRGRGGDSHRAGRRGRARNRDTRRHYPEDGRLAGFPIRELPSTRDAIWSSRLKSEHDRRDRQPQPMQPVRLCFNLSSVSIRSSS